MATMLKNGSRRKKAGIEELMLRMNGAAQHCYTAGWVDFGSVNVLPQPREEFYGIPELAIAIGQEGFINPPLVACYTPGQCQEYLDKINAMRGTSITLRDLTPTKSEGRTRYWVLIAGERRFRAATLLREVGCDVCWEQFGPGPCYFRHFGTDKLEVRISTDTLVQRALYRQLTENTHMRVPLHEEAIAYKRLFTLIRRDIDPNFSVAAFARRVGRSSETISHALRFCELPESIRSAVEDDRIGYGIALELTRLQAWGCSEEELSWWVLYAVTSNFKVATFRDIVTQWLADQSSGQLSLEALFDEAQEAERKKGVVRQALQRQAILALWQFLAYFRSVAPLFEDGTLLAEDSPFSTASTVRLFSEVVTELKRLLAHMGELVPREKLRAAGRKIKQAGRVVGALELALELNGKQPTEG